MAVMCAGWLVPAWLSLFFYYEYLQWTLIPQITGKGYLANFPLLPASLLCAAVAASWLAIVIVSCLVRRRNGKAD